MFFDTAAFNVFNSLCDAIIVAGENNTVIFINPAAEKLTGYSLNEILSSPVHNILKSVQTGEGALLSCLTNNCTRTMEADYGLLTDKNGDQHEIEFSMSPFPEGEQEKKACIITLRKIPEKIRIKLLEKKQSEDLLRRALDKAEESDKLKTAFLNQMSHEIRTPLNSILGFISLMEEELLQMGITGLAVYFDSINRSSTRLQRTIEDILAMSGIQIGNYHTEVAPIDLEQILIQILLDYEAVAKSKGLNVEFIKNTVNTLISADAFTVVQSFQHIIDNAFKFTDHGSVRVFLDGDDQTVSVLIADTGIGISEEYMRKLFTPFSQEDFGYNRRYDGNGLGLAITREYLRLNNALITVESRKGRGTEFSIKFDACRISPGF